VEGQQRRSLGLEDEWIAARVVYAGSQTVVEVVAVSEIILRAVEQKKQAATCCLYNFLWKCLSD